MKNNYATTAFMNKGETSICYYKTIKEIVPQLQKNRTKIENYEIERYNTAADSCEFLSSAPAALLLTHSLPVEFCYSKVKCYVNYKMGTRIALLS